MSDVASKVAQKGKAAAPAAAVADGPPDAIVEHGSDLYETVMEYDPSSRVPIIVILIWVCAIVGFVAYMATYLFPDLALWGKP